MKQDIILSGPQASGKNWTAYGIAATHQNVIHSDAYQIRKRLINSNLINLSNQYSLIIIDECTKEDIILIDLMIKDKTCHFDVWNGNQLATKDIKPLHIIYLTSEDLTPKDIPEHLHLIKCSYSQFENMSAFKDYVHSRLDDAGVEENPSGEHSKKGCRIGDRLDIVLKTSLFNKERLTEHNTNVVTQFMEHCKELGHELPDTLFETFFNA